uniref:Suppressor of cytokine signaling 2 n=1 Tax=Lygus hesperus TaxID=30085 RepID=A0A0A9YZI6_LYGHE
MAPHTMMDYANQEWGLVMLTSCPRCQHTFRSPCCGPCCPSYPAQHAACPTTVGPTRCTTSAHASTISLSGGCFSARNLSPGSCCGGPRSPDPSPSLPLSFVLPSPPINPKPHVPLALHNASDLDLQRLSVTLRCLKSSGWYYEGLTWQESITLLAPTAPGTFLVRESSNPSYLFSLSVQAEKGPTSVRIHYVNGYFRLDAEPSILPAVPLFDCVVKMIEYYIYTSQEPKSNRDLVFLDRSGAKYSSILLRRPLLRQAAPLQHLARLKVNELQKNGDTVPNLHVLPSTLRHYLKEYPYAH